MILPTKHGENYQKRLFRFYSKIFYKRFEHYPTFPTPVQRIQLKRMFTKYGEIQTAGAILVHFEQKGDIISEKKFPFSWIEKKVPEYMQYLQEDLGIDIDNEQALYSSIQNRVKYLDIDFEI